MMARPISTNVSEPAEASVAVGKGEVRLSLRITPAGLLATGALVSAILLPTALLVRVAIRGGARGRAAIGQAGASAARA